MKNISPLEDRVLIRPIIVRNDQTEGGLYIPDTAKKDVMKGEVLAVGEGRFAPETGVFIPTVLKKGYTILYGTNEGMEIQVDKENGEGKETVRIMREGSILLIISKNDILGK